MDIVIIVEGGNVTQVISDQEANVIIVDRDVEGLDEDQIKVVLEEDAYIYSGITVAEVKPDFVSQIKEEAK